MRLVEAQHRLGPGTRYATQRSGYMTPLPHKIGRYRVVGLLATGGMAEILLCTMDGPSGFQRPVVVKRVLPHLARETVLRRHVHR